MTKIYAQGNYIVIEANNEKRKTFQKKGVGFEIVTVPSDWGIIDRQHYNTYTIDEVGKRMFDKLQLREI